MSIVVIEPEELRRLICDAVQSVVGAQGAASEWVDARTSPLGRRAFLKLAREGAFPASLVGNKYMARRSDVDAYLERQRLTREPRRAESAAPSVAFNHDPVARALAAGRLRIVKNSEWK